MNHLIVAEVQTLVYDGVADVDLGHVAEGEVPVLLRSPQLVLVLDIDNILDGGLGLHPELVVSPNQCVRVKIFQKRTIVTY